MPSFEEVDLAPHSDAVTPHNRFPTIKFQGTTWDLRHLDPFAFRADVGREGAPLFVDVVVLFACHCFTRGDDEDTVAAIDYYRDGREVRVLCEDRYALSRRYLPQLVRELFERKIQVASSLPNYITLEVIDEQHPGLYAVFFEVEKDSARRKRMLLRVQSAYRIGSLTRRQEKAGKVNFAVLLRAAYEGRKIKG